MIDFSLKTIPLRCIDFIYVNTALILFIIYLLLGGLLDVILFAFLLMEPGFAFARLLLSY